MQFMFLIYLDEAKFAGKSQLELDSYINAMLDYDEDLKQSGHYLMSEALKSPMEAVTIRKWKNVPTQTPGPFMITTEHLSGFFIIQAKDINEATELAYRMPLAAAGSIEIRPLDQVERR